MVSIFYLLYFWPCTAPFGGLLSKCPYKFQFQLNWVKSWFKNTFQTSLVLLMKRSKIHISVLIFLSEDNFRHNFSLLSWPEGEEKVIEDKMLYKKMKDAQALFYFHQKLIMLASQFVKLVFYPFWSPAKKLFWCLIFKCETCSAKFSTNSSHGFQGLRV